MPLYRDRWILDGSGIPPSGKTEEELEREHREFLKWRYYEEQWRKFYREYEKAYARVRQAARVAKVRVSERYTPKKGEKVEFLLVTKPITVTELSEAMVREQIKRGVIAELRRKGIIIERLSVSVEVVDGYSSGMFEVYDIKVTIHGFGYVDPVPLAVIVAICAAVIAASIGVAVSMIAWERKEFWVYKQKEVEVLEKKLDVAKELAKQGKVKEAERIVKEVDKQLKEIQQEQPPSYTATTMGTGIGAGIGGALLLLAFLAFGERGEKR